MTTTISGISLSTNNFTLSGIGSGSVGTSTGSTTWDVSSAQTQVVTASGATTVTTEDPYDGATANNGTCIWTPTKLKIYKRSV